MKAEVPGIERLRAEIDVIDEPAMIRFREMAMNHPYLALAREKSRHWARQAPTLLPPLLFTRGFELGLNRLLARQLREGGLDALNHRWLAIECTDWPYRLRISLDAGRLLVRCEQGPVDACIKGDFEAFLALLQQRVDPDTLFFKRRLVATGDTELALGIKNFLDTIEWASMPLPLQRLVQAL